MIRRCTLEMYRQDTDLHFPMAGCDLAPGAWVEIHEQHGSAIARPLTITHQITEAVKAGFWTYMNGYVGVSFQWQAPACIGVVGVRSPSGGPAFVPARTSNGSVVEIWAWSLEATHSVANCY